MNDQPYTSATPLDKQDAARFSKLFGEMPFGAGITGRSRLTGRDATLGDVFHMLTQLRDNLVTHAAQSERDVAELLRARGLIRGVGAFLREAERLSEPRPETTNSRPLPHLDNSLPSGSPES